MKIERERDGFFRNLNHKRTGYGGETSVRMDKLAGLAAQIEKENSFFFLI